MLTFADLPRPFNLTAHLLDGALEKGWGDRTALMCGDRTYTYADVARLTNRVGHVLRDLGVRAGDRVLLALSDGVEFVATWYAVIKIGAVVGEVYTFLQPKDYAYYLNYSGARVAVVDAATLQKVRAVWPQCPQLRALLVCPTGATPAPTEVGAGSTLTPAEVGAAASLTPAEVDAAATPGPAEADFDACVQVAPAELTAADTTPDHIALWKFTTGSTGQPKAAVHCQAAPLLAAENYGRLVLGLQADDRVLPVPKLFFGYGRDLSTLFTFYVGAAGIVFPERSTPEWLFALIQRHRPTVMVQVPTMVNAMATHPDAGRYDLSCLRFCTSSGEALPAEVYQKWLDRFGVEILEGIGSSEAYHTYISNRPGTSRMGSVGQLVPGYRARIVDGDGREVEDGAPGQLLLSGDTTAVMYWQDYQKTKRTFQGQWLHTGDLFRRGADGYFWYQGRSDDLLKVGGIWVAPLEIENCLLEHPAVLACAVVGYSDGGLILPGAHVVLRDPSAASPALAAELQAFVRTRLSPHKYPRQVHFLRTLPKTASGKVDRKALRQGNP